MTSELGPKIVHIETRYVETDAIHFRDVVQRFTGKNSSMVAPSVGSFQTAGSDNKGGMAQYGGRTKLQEEYANAASNDGKKNNSLLSSVLLKNVSFKDFDGFLSDLPSMEELLYS